MQKQFTTLLIENANGILMITINREDKLNALNITLIDELDELFSWVYGNPEIKGVILTGKGAKAFASGGDVAVFIGMDEEAGLALARKGHRIFNKIELCPKPVIAAVNGLALGGGCELAMACHIRIASYNARFGLPEVKLGIIPGFGGTQRLVQLIGKGKAIELLMTANSIDAAQAKDIKLVNHIAQPNELIETCKVLIQKIALMAPLAVAKVIQCIYAYYEEGEDGFEKEIELFGKCVATEDFAEGVSAFLEKRIPKFKSR